MRAGGAILVLLAALGMAFYVSKTDRPAVAKVKAGEWPEPLQTSCARETWDAEVYHFTALAEYDFTATVLSTERYYFDNTSSISPIDFAIGWGPMSDLSLASELSLSQGGRWFRYRIPRGFVLSDREVSNHAANVHLIPANGGVSNSLLSVRAGDAVRLTGKLVEVAGPKGFHWRSSLSRTDTGGGACEVMWVDQFRFAQ